MGKQKSKVSYKTKSNSRKKSKRKNQCKASTKRKKEVQQPSGLLKIEKGLSDICSSLSDIALDRISGNATSDFLSTNGLNNAEDIQSKSKKNRNKKRRRNQKQKNKAYSMVKLLSTLPAAEFEESSLQNALPAGAASPDLALPIKLVTPATASGFYYDQKDASKFYKQIIRKERCSARMRKVVSINI